MAALACKLPKRVDRGSFKESLRHCLLGLRSFSFSKALSRFLRLWNRKAFFKPLDASRAQGYKFFNFFAIV